MDKPQKTGSIPAVDFDGADEGKNRGFPSRIDIMDGDEGNGLKGREDLIDKLGALDSDMEFDQRPNDSDEDIGVGLGEASETWTGNEKYEFQSILKQAHESMEAQSESKNFDQMGESKSRSELKQEKSSEMRRGAGTGTGYGRAVKERDNKMSQSRDTSTGYARDTRQDHKGLDSYYDQSQSQLTSQRSHFTSIEGPPKIYEEVMRQLEADIRKHIRIEHQLKLHIESVEDRVEELEREQDDYEQKIKDLMPHQQEVQGLQKELKSKEEVLEVKQILLEKQKTEIEELQKSNKNLKEEVKNLNDTIQKLEAENVTLQKDLKVSKSQNQRDKDKLQRIINSRQGVRTTQQFLGPYDSYIENRNDVPLESAECGTSGQSGQSGVSAMSGKSDLNGTQLGYIQTSNSVHQQLNNSYDGLSLKDSRVLNAHQLQYNTAKNIDQQMMRTHMENNFLPNPNLMNNQNLVDVNQLVHEGFQSMNHKNQKGLQLKNPDSGNSVASGNGRHTRSGKSNSESRQRGAAKAVGQTYGLGAQALDSTRVKQINQKSFLNQSSKQVQGVKLNKKQQYIQNISGAGYQLGGQGQPASCSSVGGNQSTGTTKARRGQKQSKHSSLEKFNPTLLYGTQSIPTINQPFYLGGYGVGNATQQLSGPQLLIKMQNPSGNSQSMKKGNKTHNELNNNSFTPDRLKSRQKLGILQEDQGYEQQSSVLQRDAQAYKIDPLTGMEMTQTAAFDVNDIRNTYTMTQELADLNCSSKGQSRSQSQLTQYNQSIGSNMKMPHKMQQAMQSKTGTGKKQGTKMGVVSLAGINATLQAAHNQSQKLTSKEQLQNIYNTTSSSQQKQQFRGNKNQHLPNAGGKWQTQNSRNTAGLKNNYKTVGAMNDGDTQSVSSQAQQLRSSCTQNLQIVAQNDKSISNQQSNAFQSQKQQKSINLNRQGNNPILMNNSQQNTNMEHINSLNQPRMNGQPANSLSNNPNVTSFAKGQRAGPETASTGATGGTTGTSGGAQAQRRCSSQLQNRQQVTGGKHSKELNRREMSSRANKNQSQNSNYVTGNNNKNMNNKANMRSTICGQKSGPFGNSTSNTITQSLNNTQKMRKGETNSSKRGMSNRKSNNQKTNLVQFSSNFNSNHQLLQGNKHSKHDQIQSILDKKNHKIAGEVRIEQQKTLSASSSNNGMSSLNNTLNNYQMLNYNQQSQKNILNTTYMFATHNQQPSIPQKYRPFPGREDNSQSALSITQHNDQALTHAQSINNKDGAQEEFYSSATAEKDRYKQSNSNSKFKNPANKNTNQGSARQRNSSYNSRQGKNSTSSGTRIYSANNFIRN